MGSTKPWPSRPARNRQADTRRQDRQLQTGLIDIYREANGVLGLDVLLEADEAALIAAAKRGNQHAQCLLDGVVQMLSEPVHAFKRMDCFCCGKPMDVVVAFVFIAAERDDATKQVCGLVCANCDGTREAIGQHAIAAWRQAFDPSIRELKVHPSSGRA
jgi:hypothetical protein